jgi:hypothetical protein
LDLGDHGADQVHGLGAEFGIRQQLLQLHHAMPVELGEIRVDHHGLRRLNGFRRVL